MYAEKIPRALLNERSAAAAAAAASNKTHPATDHNGKKSSDDEEEDNEKKRTIVDIDNKHCNAPARDWVELVWITVALA